MLLMLLAAGAPHSESLVKPVSKKGWNPVELCAAAGQNALFSMLQPP